MGSGTALGLPDGFWDRPEVTGLLDRHDIGALLGVIIKESKLSSQHKLAAALGFTQTQISHYISGLHRPTLDSVKRIADAVAMPCAARRRLGLSAATQEDAGASPSGIRVHRVLALAEHIGRTGDTSQLYTWRNLTSPGRIAEPWDTLASVLERDRRPYPSAEQLVMRTRGFYLVFTRLPARLVIRALSRHARDIALVLGAVERPQRRRKVTVTGGETSYLAACCSMDLGDLAGAMRQLDTIEVAARQGADPALGAMALDGRSHFQAAQRHHTRALQLVEQARSAVPVETSPGTVAYLWLRAAEEHMYCGHLREAAEAWQHAERHYAATDIGTDRNWIRLWLSRDCFDAVRAVIYAATNRPRDAAEAAERVSARLAGAEGKADAIALVNAALAQAQIGLFRQSASTGRQALRVIRAAETSGSLARLSLAADILRQHADRVPQVQPFLRDFAQTRQQLTSAQQPAS